MNDNSTKYGVYMMGEMLEILGKYILEIETRLVAAEKEVRVLQKCWLGEVTLDDILDYDDGYYVTSLSTGRHLYPMCDGLDSILHDLAEMKEDEAYNIP